MPEPANSKTDIGTGDISGSDKFRESPELKFNKRLGPKIADTDSNSVTRELPRFAEDEAYMFGRPNQLGRENVSDFRPDQLRTDGSQPRHVIPDETNDSLTRDSLGFGKK